MNIAALRTPGEDRLFWPGVAYSGIAWVALALTRLGRYALAVLALLAVARLLENALFRGNAVRVTARQFPGLHEAIERARGRLGLERPIDGYLVQTPRMAVSSFHLFGPRRLFIPSALVVGCIDTRQVDFFVGREIASMTSRGAQWSEFLLPFRFLPWVGAAYERARERTNDRCGLVAAGDLEPALRGLLVLSAGAKQAPHVDLAAFGAQRVECASSAWMSLLELASPSPFLSTRVAALRTYVAPGSEREVPRPALTYALVAASWLGIAGAIGAANLALRIAPTAGDKTASVLAATIATRVTGQSPSCGEFDPARVYLQGNIREARGSVSAITELDPGTRWCGVLPRVAMVRRDGTLAYARGGGHRDGPQGGYAVFTEDVLVRTVDGYRTVDRPEANDEYHELPWGELAQRVHFWPDRDGAAFEYGPSVYRDTREAMSKSGYILGLGYEGYWLRGESRALGDSGVAVIGPDNEAHPSDVVLKAGDVLAVRAVPDGFLVAYGKNARSPRAYRVGRDGAVESLGTYAVLDGYKTWWPPGYVLDASGALYDFEESSDRSDRHISPVVARRPLEPDAASIVYRDDDRPVSTFQGTLVTGP
jgi:hypothetical protein